LQVNDGLNYFRALMPYQINASAELTQLVEAGDLEAVRAAYLSTRPIYEQIEVGALRREFEALFEGSEITGPAVQS
jgi:iron uptake system EfeUOB component EfeO/EfeM